MRRSDAIEHLRRHRQRLAELGVTRAYLFGSIARDAAEPGSDIDIMIDLDEGEGGRKPLFSAFDLGEIQHELTVLFGRRVDLVVRDDAMKPGQRLRSVAQEQLVCAF